jgi:hypothetical protein
MQSIVLQLFYLVPVAATADILAMYDVPHSSIITTPVKALRLQEAVRVPLDNATPSSATAPTKSATAIDKHFAQVQSLGALRVPCRCLLTPLSPEQNHPLRLLYVDDNKINVVGKQKYVLCSSTTSC